MPTRQPNDASFLRDVADHRMVVVRDDGVHRHLRFKKPDTGSMHFDVVTWPGYLCYSGDMGCYVFSRLPDMFDFFRRDPGYQYGIDFRYWAEKLHAVDRCDGVEQYSKEKFREAVQRDIDAAFEDEEGGAPQDLRDAVSDRVLSRADDGEHEAIRAAMEFEREGFQFHDFYEHDIREYSYRFLWCCHALAWAVRTYDARHEIAITA